ncbi:MAG TPA: F0F1 ATP synthase subunit B [Planctomycetota bacterium]|nr:F0F1 ATP synthase subunit B [Planctomycetota bacterium]
MNFNAMALLTCWLQETHAAESGGFNPLDVAGAGNFLWTLIIFLAALLPIWKFVMGPITRALAERDARAEQAIQAAQKASGDAERARAEVEARLTEARAEAQRIVAESRARAEAVGKQVEAGSRAEAGKLLEQAKREIEVERDKALASIRSEVVDLSLSAASAVLQRNVGSADDRKLVGESLVKLKGAAKR